MNEEQKEQNIPAPVPSENNNQNIAPVKRWQIKSWQIVLVGTILQAIYSFGVVYIDWSTSCKSGGCDMAGIIGFIFLVSGIISVFGMLLITGLLRSSLKYQQIGAKLSFAFTAIVTLSVYLLILFPGVIILFIAGIYYFWKKV